MDQLEFERRSRDLLAKASVISEAPALNIEAEKTTHSKSGTVAPSRRGLSLHEEIHRTFKNVRRPDQRNGAIEWAEEALKAARQPPRPEKGMAEPGSLAWKREIADAVDEAKTAKDVGEIARVHGISRATAYNYRRQYGQSEAA